MSPERKSERAPNASATPDPKPFRALVFIGEIGGRERLRDALALALGREIPDGWFWIEQHRE